MLTVEQTAALCERRALMYGFPTYEREPVPDITSPCLCIIVTLQPDIREWARCAHLPSDEALFQSANLSQSARAGADACDGAALHRLGQPDRQDQRLASKQSELME